MNVYEQLEAAVLPMMTDYQGDLTKWDRAMIEKNPGMLFLHYARESNTYLIMLMPPSDYPPRGEYVPYLFGQADRRHIVSQVTEMAEYFTMRSNLPKLVHYFDGKRLRKIDEGEAKRIAWVYRRATEAAFDGKQLVVA
jgi:hypothetical protein